MASRNARTRPATGGMSGIVATGMDDRALSRTAVGALDRRGDRGYVGAVGLTIRSSFVVAAVVLVLLGAAVGVGAATNNIATVAGTGTAGFSGDGNAATSAQLNGPAGVAASADGGFLIADTSNDRVRRVSPAGTISTVAGTNTGGCSGDGGAATSAQLSVPVEVAASADGGFLIADASNNRVRRVSPAGTISTVAGNGTAGSAGDGGAATSAQLDFPAGVAATADGDYLIADSENNRVRRVDAGDPAPVAPSPVAPPSLPPPVAVKAVISEISLSPRSPRASTATKAKLSFTLNVAKRVTVRLDRIVAGRKSARRCVKPTCNNRARRKCRRPSKVAARTVAAKAGANTVTLGTLAGKNQLRRGSYRITLSATGATKKTVAFKIRR